MNLQSTDWSSICQNVTKIALPILPHIRSNKVCSEIISSLFETAAADYYNSISTPVQACQTDRQPDLLFLESNKPLEIKVTRSDHTISHKFKWMGGKYSKRTSDYVFIAWCYQPTMNTLYGTEQETIRYFIAKTYVNESEWRTIDNGNENYYATIYTTDELFQSKYEVLVGKYINKTIELV